MIRNVFRRAGGWRQARRREAVFAKYRPFTMVGRDAYLDNLSLVETARHLPGAVVECGVWKGGMIAGMAETLGPDREYVLCDSFEGLPPATDEDGDRARRYQADTGSPLYLDNCAAPEEVARRAMSLSPATRVRFVRGWFDQTLPGLELSGPIAVLRLDGDWYDSTMTCLTHLLPRVAPGGLVVIDDYYNWDGCAKAVHDYLSRAGTAARLTQWCNGPAYIRIPADAPRKELP